MILLGATLASAQTPAAPDTGYTATIRNSWNSVKRYVAASAEKMPEADYAFKPTPDVRSFGELVGHLANEHYLLCSPLKLRSLSRYELFEACTKRFVAANCEQKRVGCLAFAKVDEERFACFLWVAIKVEDVVNRLKRGA